MEENEPTIKQLEYAKDIAYELGLELPLDRSRLSISTFISENVKDYKKAIGKDKWYHRHD